MFSTDVCSPDLVLKRLQGAFHKLFIYCQEVVKTLMCQTCFSRGTHPTAEQELNMNKCSGRSVWSLWLSDGIISSEIKTNQRQKKCLGVQNTGFKLEIKVSDEMI